MDALDAVHFLASGRNENRSTKGKYAKQKEQALLTRLEKYKKPTLSFYMIFQYHLKVI